MMRTDNENHDPVKLLSDLIRIDTSNPPGNEEAAVQFLEALLLKEGIKARDILARAATGKHPREAERKKRGSPVILLGHLDVVPAHDEGWGRRPSAGQCRTALFTAGAL